MATEWTDDAASAPEFFLHHSFVDKIGLSGKKEEMI
jgi:hypothetical protein